MRPGRWKCLGVMGATPPLWIPAFAGMTKGSRVTPFSYQSLMPAGAGTSRYARLGCWLVEEFEGHWCLELVPMWSHPHPNPLPKGEGDLDPFVAGSVRGDWASRRLRQSWIVARGPGCGQAPALHLSYSILGCRCYEDGGRCRRPVSESIPDRSPGHAFVPMPRMIHSLLIETVGESVWAKLLGTTSHGSCFAWARIETLQYRRLEVGRRG